MKLRILILAFAALVLAIPAQAQSLRYLAYDTTNWTVLGWTNTNALRFTNAIEVGGTRLTTNTNLSVLTYNTTNFTVQGWTNTNALTITNKVTASGVTISNGWLIVDQVSIDLGNGVFYLGTNAIFSYNEDLVTFYKPAAFGGSESGTRSNLFGHPGLTTNISVLVPGGGTNTLRFSNGSLLTNTVP